MKYKIFYSFKGGSENSNNSVETTNVEDLEEINLEGQNPTDKQVLTSQSISSNQPLTDEQRKELKLKKEKERQKAKKKRQKEKKKAENSLGNEDTSLTTSSTSSTSTSKAKKAENSLGNEDTSLTTSSTSNSLNLPFNPFSMFLSQKSFSKPDDLDKDILILGENHSKNRYVREKLKEEYIKKGAYIFGEGFLKTDQTENLDEYYSSFRASILIASLIEKVKQYFPSDDSWKKDFLIRNLDVLDRILENSQPPPDTMRLLRNNWNEINKNPGKQKINKELKKKKIITNYLKNGILLDYNSIYAHYFPNDDTYHDDMIGLLGLSASDAIGLITACENHHLCNIFNRIMREAREMKMVERVLAYMNQPKRKEKIVIFTGIKHVDKLYEELSKNYTVKKRNIDE